MLSETKYTIEKVRRYPENILFLVEDGKRICRITRQNTVKKRLPGDYTEIYVVHAGRRYYYDNSYKITKIENDVGGR